MGNAGDDAIVIMGIAVLLAIVLIGAAFGLSALWNNRGKKNNPSPTKRTPKESLLVSGYRFFIDDVNRLQIERLLTEAGKQMQSRADDSTGSSTWILESYQQPSLNTFVERVRSNSRRSKPYRFSFLNGGRLHEIYNETARYELGFSLEGEMLTILLYNTDQQIADDMWGGVRKEQREHITYEFDANDIISRVKMPLDWFEKYVTSSPQGLHLSLTEVTL